MVTHGFRRGGSGGHSGGHGGFRRPFSRSRSYSRPPGGAGRRNFRSVSIDPSKFVNKAVITEEVERFIPEHSFQDFAVDERLKNNVQTKGYVDPTPIQDKSIPHILRGSDVVGIANTGTGKTAAFLIPLIHKVLTQKREKVLIIVPTRELALQIEKELVDFVRGLPVWGVVCVGGVGIGPQLSGLRRQHSFVIGTPGRLKDLIERKALDPSQFATIVLDEADRMLDMGFVNDMRYVMKLMPEKRHTLFFSATLSPEIDMLIKDFLKEPVRISVKTRDTAKGIDQDVIRISHPSKKLDTLEGLLRQPGFDKVIIFGRTKHGVEKLSRELVMRGFKAESIHGNKNHNKRQKALDFFKRDHVQILVATDVAARGLDIANVSHVINYDLPATYDDYVHRIGRTGRGGKKGIALTFVE